MNLNKHIRTRIQQRGFRHGDLEIVMKVATQTPDGLFVRRKDAEREIQRLIRERNAALRRLGTIDTETALRYRRRIDRVARLVGTFVPQEQGRSLSIYRPSRRREKRELRELRKWRTRRQGNL